jgi:DUF971 family protein
MALDIPEADPPVAIDLDRTRSLRLEWADGRAATFALETLRSNCPCAACRAVRDRGNPVWPPSHGATELRANDAELVGNWGLQITWHDGHSTGIYAWGVLRAWAGLDDAGEHTGAGERDQATDERDRPVQDA